MEKTLDLLNFLAVLILSVAFHEMAHAWLANRFGDDTPRAHGRMTLNPFAHIHPILTVALPAYVYWTSGGIMFMAMTPVSPHQMRKPRLHGMLTALGGPAASLLLGIVCFVAMVGYVVAVGGVDPGAPDQKNHFLTLFILAVELNVFGAVFNLVPIPPLDGASIVEFYLPARARRFWDDLKGYAWILFAVLVFSGILGRLLRPAMKATWALVVFGIDLGNGIADGR